MDIIRLFQDYSIRRAHEGDKHYRDGWVNLPCPFCSGHSGNHLGYSLGKNFWKCWRCGSKKNTQVIQKLLGISYYESKRLIRKYQGRVTNAPVQITVKRVQFKMPEDAKPIFKRKVAMKYLIKTRGFSKIDAFWIAKKFELYATKDMGYLEYLGKEIDLSYRILAPIYHENQIVSWQTRDFTGYASLKYITCPAAVEKKEHKTVLYNAPDLIEHPIIVLCEGIVDVWKVTLSGFPATCCFGVEYTYDQFNLLKKYKKINIFLDPDKAGELNAKKLMKQLIFAGTDADIVNNKIGIDPGDMNKKQIKKILKKYFEI